jgi:hypothetical protein
MSETTAVRLAQHLATEAHTMRCELVALKGEEDWHEAWPENRGRCKGDTVAVKWEDGFADSVCERHARNAEERGALVVWPKRHDGKPEPAPEGKPVHGCMVCATYRAEGRACPTHRTAPEPAPAHPTATRGEEGP